MPGTSVTSADLELIEIARDVIRRSYDAEGERHTVGAALRCGSGSVHVGVNVYSLHGSCAEFVAVGSAVAAGETEFIALAAVRGADGQELLPPCGNCRQLLADLAPECRVLVPGDSGPVAIAARELLPFACKVE